MDAYRIGVSIVLANGVSPVLAILSRDLLGVHTKVKDLEGGFSRLKLAIGGALSATAGLAILGTMTSLIEKTKDYSDELAKLKNLGGSMSEAVASGMISKQAFDISQRVPMKVTDLMKIPGMTNSMLGTTEALDTWEDVAKLAFVLQAQKGYHGDPGSDVQKVLRAGELSGRITDAATGQIDPDKLRHYLDTTARITAATHGMVGPDALLGMAQQGGISLRGLTDDGFYHMAIAAQAFGGNRAGTALMSTWQQIAAGQMFTRTAEGMEAAGLLKTGEWHTDHGRVILDDVASKRLTKLIGNDPLQFAHQMDENLKAQGITDPVDRQRMIMRGLGRATTQRFTLEEAQNYGQTVAETDRMKQGFGVLPSLDTFMNESVGTNMEALKNSWENLMMAVAGPNSQNAISIMQSLTGAINGMTAYVTALPTDTITSIATGIGALGLALTGGGIAAVLAALGPVGWIAAGVTAIALAAAKWGPDIFKGIYAALEGAADLLTRAFNGIAASISSFIDSIATLYNRVKSFLTPGPVSPEAKKFNNELDQANKNYVPMRFTPGANTPRAQNASFSLNVDGRALAQSVIDHLESIYGMPSGAPAADGANSYFGGDHQYTSI